MGSSPPTLSVWCCKHYGVSPDESRPSGSQNLAGIHERPQDDKRPKVCIRTESGRDTCAQSRGREQGYWEAPGTARAILGRLDIQDVEQSQDAKADVQDTQNERGGRTLS